MQSLRTPLSALTRSASLRPSLSLLPRLPSSSSSSSPLSTSPSSLASVVPRSARQTPPNSEPPKYKRARKPAPGAPQTELFEALADVPAVRGRPQLINEEAARQLVRAWGVDRMEDCVVVDSWAGPGGLARAYLELPNVKKYIAIEEAHRYDPMLDVLKEKYGDRFVHVKGEPFLWESYTEAEKHFADLVPKRPFSEGVHPNLFVSAQLPNSVYGNLMAVQMISAIAGEMWYYQYGRVSMGFLGTQAFWNKCLARPGDPGFHKLAVLLPMLASLTPIESLTGYRPPEVYFHKPRGDPGVYSAVKVVPHEKPLVKNYDALEYIARNMFVQRAKPWHKALSSAAPGANNLIQPAIAAGLTDMKKTVQQLSLAEWALLADIFEDWSFRPQTLFDDFSWAEDRI